MSAREGGEREELTIVCILFSVSSVNMSVRDGGEREELLAERNRLVSRLHDTLAKIDRY